MSSFDAQLKDSRFFQQIIAELQQRHDTLRAASEQAIAMLATAAARQMNTETVAQNLERMEAMFARQVPNEIRSEMIRLATSLIRNSGTPADSTH